MKKIIFLHPHFILPWWAGNFTLETAKYLSFKKEYNVFIVSWKQSDFIIWEYKNKNINFIELKIPLTSSFYFWLFYPIWFIKIIKSINKIKKQDVWEIILFPQVFPANWWWGIYKIFNKNIKVVFMCHEPSAFIHSKKWINSINSFSKRTIAKILNQFLKKIDILLMSRSDIIITNSEFTKKEALKIYKKVNWIIYPWFSQKLFFIDNSIKKEKYIWIVSRITKFKNIDFAIDLFVEFLKDFPEFKLKIWWEWEYKEELLKKVNNLWLSEQIIFLWSIKDNELRSFYQKARFILFTSKDEPFWMVPVEAMACWTIVVWNDSWWLKETLPEKYRYNNGKEALNIMKSIILNDEKLKYNISKFNCENTLQNLKNYF